MISFCYKFFYETFMLKYIFFIQTNIAGNFKPEIGIVQCVYYIKLQFIEWCGDGISNDTFVTTTFETVYFHTMFFFQ